MTLILFWHVVGFWREIFWYSQLRPKNAPFCLCEIMDFLSRAKKGFKVADVNGCKPRGCIFVQFFFECAPGRPPFTAVFKKGRLLTR